MSTATRKQREIQEREARILEVSRPMLIAQGYHGLSMDRIAETLQYSKGTIYNHFRCKEEIILALAIETTEKRTGLFQRAAAFAGGSRERIQAIGAAAELFVRLFPDHFRVEQVVRSASVWEKTSEKRRLHMHLCEQQCMGIVAGIARDGIAQGDLVLADGATAEDLVFGLWSLAYGAYSLITTSDYLGELGIGDPHLAVRAAINGMLDGWGWRPVSSEHDYDAVLNRIHQEVFPDEFSTAFA